MLKFSSSGDYARPKKGLGGLPAMLVSARGELGLPIMQATEPICSNAAKGGRPPLIIQRNTGNLDRAALGGHRREGLLKQQ